MIRRFLKQISRMLTAGLKSGLESEKEALLERMVGQEAALIMQARQDMLFMVRSGSMTPRNVLDFMFRQLDERILEDQKKYYGELKIEIPSTYPLVIRATMGEDTIFESHPSFGWSVSNPSMHEESDWFWGLMDRALEEIPLWVNARCEGPPDPTPPTKREVYPVYQVEPGPGPNQGRVIIPGVEVSGEDNRKYWRWWVAEHVLFIGENDEVKSVQGIKSEAIEDCHMSIIEKYGEKEIADWAHEAVVFLMADGGLTVVMDGGQMDATASDNSLVFRGPKLSKDYVKKLLWEVPGYAPRPRETEVH